MNCGFNSSTIMDCLIVAKLQYVKDSLTVIVKHSPLDSLQRYNHLA
jgi:hypothetical protein